MTPFFRGYGVTIYQGDCREILPALPQGRNGAGLLLTDPPYGTSTGVTGHRVRSLDINEVSQDAPADVPLIAQGLAAAWSALRFYRHAYVFGPFELSSLKYAGAVCELIWDKEIATMGNLAIPWGQRHERIGFAIRHDGVKAATRNGGGLAARLRRGSVLRYQRPNASGASRHPTEKPVALLRELIECSSLPGDEVLDPFMGSGSTLVAAALEGRTAVGVDVEEAWCEAAARRVEAVAKVLGELDKAEPLARKADEMWRRAS